MHIKKIKGEKCITISTEEKHLIKFMNKTLSRVVIAGNFLNPIKAICKKFTASINSSVGKY